MRLSVGGEVVLRDCCLSADGHGCSAWGVLLWSDVIIQVMRELCSSWLI